MKSERTWVVIADGAHAKVLQYSPEKAKLEPVKGIAFEISLPRTHDILSDRAGRSFESNGPARHAKSGRNDPHRELKRGVARKIADVLQSSLANKRYDKLVLEAPPATLGDRREALAESVQSRLSADVTRDLIKTPASQLSSHLVGVLPIKDTGYPSSSAPSVC
jgi:protein required for attachment to host cells